MRELVARREEEHQREKIMDITGQDGLGGFYRYMYDHEMEKGNSSLQCSSNEDPKSKEPRSPRRDTQKEVDDQKVCKEDRKFSPQTDYRSVKEKSQNSSTLSKTPGSSSRASDSGNESHSLDEETAENESKTKLHLVKDSIQQLPNDSSPKPLSPKRVNDEPHLDRSR
ncbi:unnamed protein product [Echinostoma caproni]|uniref:LNP1 n=1 Tax=Echinostoma caproni TaxID=27848 RepID=A0A183BH16_9TREM|nr:unnamed protein product [Echinostoma caproni]